MSSQGGSRSSRQDQWKKASNATAVSSGERILLFSLHTAFAMCQRMWEFSMVIFLTYLVPTSLTFVALLGIAENLAVFSLSGTIGQWLDRTDRLKAIRILLTVKNVIFVIVMVLLVWLFSMNPEDPSVAHAKLISAYLIPLIAAAAGLCFSSVTLAVEKDWVVVLSHGDSEWLSHTNSVMSQIDLACDSLGPALMGFIFASVEVSVAAAITSVVNICAVIVMYIFLQRLYKSYPPLQSSLHVAQLTDPAEEDITACLRFEGLAAFMRSGCTVFLIAYSMIYLTVLSYHSLMTAFIIWEGLPVFYVGVGRGLCALFGFIGATIYPYAVSKFGLVNAATAAIWYQFCLIAVAGASFFFAKQPSVLLAMLLIPVIFSRTGLWLFDLAVRQLAQETILADQRGLVNGTWRSIIALFELVSFVLALVFNHPKDFWILALVSMVMVGGAALLVSQQAIVRTIWGSSVRYTAVAEQNENASTRSNNANYGAVSVQMQQRGEGR